MDFTQFRDGSIVPDMRVRDLPADARIFAARPDGLLISVMIANTANRSWQFAPLRYGHDGQYVWQTWAHEQLAHSIRYGIEITRGEAEALECARCNIDPLPEGF